CRYVDAGVHGLDHVARFALVLDDLRLLVCGFPGTYDHRVRQPDRLPAEDGPSRAVRHADQPAGDTRSWQPDADADDDLGLFLAVSVDHPVVRKPARGDHLLSEEELRHLPPGRRVEHHTLVFRALYDSALRQHQADTVVPGVGIGARTTDAPGGYLL